MSLDKSEVTSMLTSLRNELKKEFIELDGEQRPVKYFQAPLHVADGESCLITEVEYVGPGSSIVIKSKESIGTWLAAMDL